MQTKPTGDTRLPNDAKAAAFGKPRTEPRLASRRLGILLAGLGTLHE